METDAHHDLHPTRYDAIRYGCIMISPCRHLIMSNSNAPPRPKAARITQHNSTHLPPLPERFKWDPSFNVRYP
ncbi:1-phosphatidylinositol 4,5-bisphosphate phosphodiesterase delta-4 [Fusarium oxysporum f. sp. albedinis]|uniref:Uncharacterized protein n=2 Tax=Fusarium oxysporum f. sp. cubense TaxID=61366 RepID=N4THI6_FUSC1|nr:hypothetical protein FOC1_g10014967 [Fusarium oxysporum f. sp. cubense race 1]KAJ0156802.1 1-phosphatidylinositol 4,5-bisphosphate phosphodiesterase delta-4 [Fusarium oxysporum f. sp. albedinis]TXC06685.1 hypothetical protein FocTR4_00009913 [Fusarium oxysporum f. sp. cubense]